MPPRLVEVETLAVALYESHVRRRSGAVLGGADDRLYLYHGEPAWTGLADRREWRDKARRVLMEAAADAS